MYIFLILSYSPIIGNIYLSVNYMIHKIFIAFCIVFFFVGLVILYKSGHFLKKFFSSAIQGALAFLAVNLTGMITGVTLSVNWFTICSAMLYGIPGCIMLLVTQILFR